MAHDPREPRRREWDHRLDRPLKLADIKDTEWVWLYCRNGPYCHHYSAVRFADLIQRYGPGITIEQVRFSARCTGCGHKGALTKMPRRTETGTGWATFPEQHDAKRKWDSLG